MHIGNWFVGWTEWFRYYEYHEQKTLFGGQRRDLLLRHYGNLDVYYRLYMQLRPDCQTTSEKTT